MDNILNNLSQLIIQYPSWKYIIIGVGIILQGEIAILISTYLIANGSLNWSEFLTVAPFTLFVVESFIYANGRILRNTRFGWHLYRRIKLNQRFQFYLFYFKKNITKLFIISKFLPATNLIFFFLTGWAKIQWRQFLKNHLLSLSIWFGSMTTIAYSITSGLYYLKAAGFKWMELSIAVILLFIIIAEFLARRLLKKLMAIYEKTTAVSNIIEKEIK